MLQIDHRTIECHERRAGPRNGVLLEEPQLSREACFLPSIDEWERLTQRGGQDERRLMVRAHALELRAGPAVLVVVAREVHAIRIRWIGRGILGEIGVDRAHWLLVLRNLVEKMMKLP